jgi:hypothetical protein
MWESLVVILGHRTSSLFGDEFLSAPIHSPLSGHLIGPSVPFHFGVLLGREGERGEWLFV